MADNDSNDGAADLRSAFTSLRTWELELFVSGATVFALLQAPAAVDRWWHGTEAHLDENARMATFFVHYFVKLVLYTLIATFVLHLITRAYWVALVGARAVYPHGVRWEEMKFGPAFLEAYRRRLPPLDSTIARVDRLSSLLFSGGAVVLLTVFASVVYMAVAALLAAGTSAAFFGGRHFMTIVLAFALAFSVVVSVLRTLDVRSGRRGVEAPSKKMARLAVLSYHLSLTPLLGPLSLVLSSNLGRRTATSALTAVFVAIIATFLVRDVLLGNQAIRFDSYPYLPDEPSVQYADPDYYEDRRNPATIHATPVIQSEMIEDAYVRLFIPITPRRHNVLIRERCPGVATFRSGLRLVGRPGPEPPDIEPVIRCLAALHPVSLDGAPLEGLAFRLTTEPSSGLRGIVAFIPVTGLAAGEHLLRIDGLPRPREGGTEADRPRPPVLIRFWTSPPR